MRTRNAVLLGGVVLLVVAIGIGSWWLTSQRPAAQRTEIPEAVERLWILSPELPNPSSRVGVYRSPGTEPMPWYHWEYGHGGESGGEFVVFRYVSRESGRPVIALGSETGYLATGVEVLAKEIEGEVWWEYAKVSKTETTRRLAALE